MWYIVSTQAVEKVCWCVSRNYLKIFSEKLYYMWEMCKFAHITNINECACCHISCIRRWLMQQNVIMPNQ